MPTPAGPPLIINNPHPVVFEITAPCDTAGQGVKGSIDYYAKSTTCWYVAGLPILPIRIDPVLNNVMEMAEITNLNFGIWLTPAQTKLPNLQSAGWMLV